MSSSIFRAFWLLCSLLICVTNAADYRLEGSVVPSHYNLTIGVLRNSVEPTIFDGEVSITLRVVGTLEVQQIILHADTLDITECWLLGQRINARLVLPCFDEPALKAQFQLQIVRPNGYQSIANTKLKETKALRYITLYII